MLTTSEPHELKSQQKHSRMYEILLEWSSRGVGRLVLIGETGLHL